MSNHHRGSIAVQFISVIAFLIFNTVAHAETAVGSIPGNFIWRRAQSLLRRMAVTFISVSTLFIFATAAHTETVVGSIPGNFSVSPSGAATYSVPIEMPPGVNGLKPSISLEYNSQSGNDLLGAAWSLGGLSTIERCPKTLAQDGAINGIINETIVINRVSLSTGDRLCLDGQRLVLASGSNDSDATYWSTSAEYRTEKESFSKVTRSGNGFKVETKDGQVMLYGTTTDSARNVTITSSNMPVLSWSINNISDPSGNSISFLYYEDATQGVHYLQSVSYLNNAVTFSYEDRSDKEVRYMVGAKISTINRLSKITTKVNSTTVYEYSLLYENASQTGRSRIMTIKKCAGASGYGGCLKDLVFAWQGGTSSFNSPVNTGINNTGQQYQPKSMDVNGDGRTDLVLAYNNTWHIRFSNGSGFGGDVDTGFSNTYYAYAKVINFNGDNSDDLFYPENNVWKIFLGGASGFTKIDTGIPDTSYIYTHMVNDMSGDGLADMVYVKSDNKWYFRLNTGGAFGNEVATGIDATNHGLSHVLDYNGDGKMDVLIPTGGVWKILQSNGAGFDLISTGISNVGYNYNPHAADVNGDGLSDLVLAYSNTWHIRLNTGNGFGTDIDTGINNQYWEYSQIIDFNGDGKMDLVFPKNNVWNILLSTGDNFKFVATTLPGTGAAYSPQFPDLNGDGFTDSVQAYSSTWNIGLNGGANENNILSIDNGLGVVTTVQYSPLSAGTNYVKETTASYPVQDIRNSKNIVASQSISDGLGGTRVISYVYYGMKQHLRGRGSLGFHYMYATDAQTGLVTKTEFSQDYHSAGVVLTATTKTSAGKLISSTVVNSAIDITKVTFGGTLLNSYNDMKDERWLTYVNKSTVTKYDLGSYLLGTTVNQTVFDNFGNAISSTVTTTDPNTSIAYKQVTTSQYDYVNSSVWCQKAQLTKTQSYSETNGTPSDTITKSFTYTASCKLETETTEPGTSNSATTTYSYDSFGNNTSVAVSGQDITSRTSTTAFDSNGQFPVTVKNAMGHKETRVFDSLFGAVTSSTGPNDLIATSQYDGFGRLSVVQTADGNRTEISRQWCTSGCTIPAIKNGYSSQSVSYIVTTRHKGSNLIEFTPPTKVYYDKFNREVRREGVAYDGTAIYVDTNYNALGQVVVSTTPYFYNDTASKYANELQYDVLGAVTRQTESTGTVVDISNNTGLTKTYTSTIQSPYRAESKVENYNAIGQLLSVKDNSNQITTFGYNTQGNRTTTTDPLGHVVTVSYDKFGRKISMNDPDMGAWSYTYNVLGELVSQKDAKLQTTSMSYDILGRMIKRSDYDGLVSEWKYNDNLNAGNVPKFKAIGKLNSETSSNSYSREYNFDSLGRPSYEIVTIGAQQYQTDTSYDTYGRPDVLSYPNSVNGRFQVKHVYLNGQLQKVTSADGVTPYWTADVRDALNQVQSDHYGNNLQIMRTFDVAGRVNWINIGDASTLYEARYAYDSIGNITQRKSKRNQGSAVELVEDYVYDNLNRLTNVNSAQISAVTLTYDGIGNITNKTGVGAYTYSATKPHAVTGVPGKTYSYDANGNMISGDGRTITWASYNYPTVIESISAKSNFTYGPNRARFGQSDLDKSTNKTQITHYVSSLFERVLNTSGVYEYKHYINAGGQTIGVHTRRSNNVTDTNYLLRDYQGTVVALVDSAGVAKGHLDYDAFGARRPILGQTTVSTIIQTNPRGYTNHEHLDKLNLIHMNGRVYDPVLGRFLSADPVVQAPENLQSLNRYSYVMNNPMSYTDPSGFRSLKDKLHRLANIYVKSIVWGGMVAGGCLAAGPAGCVAGAVAGAKAYHEAAEAQRHGARGKDLAKVTVGSGLQAYTQMNLILNGVDAYSSYQFTDFTITTTIQQRVQKEAMTIAERNGWKVEKLFAISLLGNLVHGSRYLGEKDGVDYIDGLGSRYMRGSKELYKEVSVYSFDAADIVLGYMGVPTASAMDYVLFGKGSQLVGYSLGALDANNISNLGLTSARVSVVSLPMFNAGSWKASVTIGDGDIVNLGYIGKVFTPHALVVPAGGSYGLGDHRSYNYDAAAGFKKGGQSYNGFF